MQCLEFPETTGFLAIGSFLQTGSIKKGIALLTAIVRTLNYGFIVSTA
jgi:hypothetical protein